MGADTNSRSRTLAKLDREWSAFRESWAGLADDQIEEPRTLGDWSIKDVIAHITIWEQEALKHLPTIAEGGRTPRYAAVGGIDAFNDRAIEARRQLSLTEICQLAGDVHERLTGYLQSVPEEMFSSTARFRRRLRLDTYGHYPLHADAVRAWRDASSKEHGRGIASAPAC